VGVTVLFDAAALLSILGSIIGLAGWVAVARFAARPTSAPIERPPVTVLKPLYGEEPLLEEALLSCFSQDYPVFQIVFGLHDQNDPALAVVHRLQARFPECDVSIVVDPALHGPNRKVSNLINMLKAARYEVLVISDSDLHLPPNYLERLVAELEKPGTGLVTSAYIGLPPPQLGWQSKLGAAQITHNFLPGVLLSRALGREDCLGSTAMLRRSTLEQTGGLGALVSVLAEDNVLGQRVHDLGLSIGLTDAIVPATVPEPSLLALWHHEVRWTRTIRASAPLALAASTLQYPLFWALMVCALSGGAFWSLAFFVASWALRSASVMGVDAVLQRQIGSRAPATPIWLLPVRDVLSVVEIAASYLVEDVIWRGHKIDANGLELDRIVVPVVDATGWSKIGSD
jgi:ceramide glucosyltransferase